MGDFTVSGGDRARTVTGVRVNGSAVELTWMGAEHGEAGIQVSYTQPDPGRAGKRCGGAERTNETPDTTSPEVSTHQFEPGSDRTYAAGDEIEVTVTFSETGGGGDAQL